MSTIRALLDSACLSDYRGGVIAVLLSLLLVQQPDSGGLRSLTTIYLPDSLSGISSPSCLLPVPEHGKMYVGSGNNECVIAVDTRTRQKVARIGPPRFVARMLYVSQTDRVYCVNSGDSTITVIDPRRDSVVATVVVGHWPRDAAFCPVNGRLYCSTREPGGVTVVDCGSNRVVGRLKAGEGWGVICYNPARNKMYVADSRSGNVFVVDCATDSVVALVPADQELATLYYSQRHDRVYFGGLTSYVGVIDCARDSLLRGVKKDWSRVENMVGDDELDLLYAADPNGKVYIVDCASDRLLDTVVVGKRIGALSLDPVANRLYCALVDDLWRDGKKTGQSKTLAIIDCERRALLKILPGGADPNSGTVARDPLTGDVYLTNPSATQLTILDPKSNSFVEAVTLGCRPGPTVYSPVSGRLYCAEGWGKTLFCIDAATNRVRKTLPLGHATGTLCLNSDSSLLYCVGGRDSSYLTIVDCRTDSIVRKVGLSRWAGAACFNPADGCLYCAGLDSIAILDGRTGARVARVQVHESGQPCCVPDLNRVFAPSVSMVAAIDGRTHAPAARIAVGNRVRALYYDSAGRKLYCANAGSDNISVLDAESYKYLGTIQTLGFPEELVGDPVSRRLYCLQWDGGAVAVINMNGDSVVAQVPVGTRPEHLVPLPGWLLCTFSRGGAARVIDTRTLRVTDSLDLAGTAENSVWVSPMRRLYISNYAGSSLTVLEDVIR